VYIATVFRKYFKPQQIKSITETIPNSIVLESKLPIKNRLMLSIPLNDLG
jgi:hypothetical protein